MKNPFIKHPHSVNETYFQHMKYAFRCGFRIVFAGIACLIHGICPFFFTNTASKTIIELHDGLKCRKETSMKNSS